MSVRMRHPSLPSKQIITVADIAVPHHRAAGWLVVDEPPAPVVAPVETKEQPAAEGGDSETVAPKRRRTQKEES